MKLLPLRTLLILMSSPPVRGRGLKQATLQDGARRSKVAPRAGAWIETWLKYSPSAPL